MKRILAVLLCFFMLLNVSNMGLVYAEGEEPQPVEVASTNDSGDGETGADDDGTDNAEEKDDKNLQPIIIT